MSHHIKNITLSTQRSDVSGYELIDIVEKYNGILIPAHIFTPHKSYYGNCVDRLKDVFKYLTSVTVGDDVDVIRDNEFAGDNGSAITTLHLGTNFFKKNRPTMRAIYGLLPYRIIS